MAADALPYGMPRWVPASESFGEWLCETVFPNLIEKYLDNPAIANATIVKDGKLTAKFAYLVDFSSRDKK